MIACKVHKQNSETLIALSDSILINTVIKDGDIEFSVSNEFYGSEAKEEEILDNLKKATIINAIGHKSIELLIKNRYISADNILLLSGVPHAQAIFM